jgi:hypothetical protein
MIMNYVTTRKDSRLWVGTIEAILALCYIRFKTGAKFRLKKGFKIGNDHSHPVKLGEYQFNLQGMKRLLLGGNSSDLLNFKTPVFYASVILNKLRPENKSILIKICRESIQSLLDTYQKDILAREALMSMDLIFKNLQDDLDLEELKKYLYINEDYMESPLTKKNMELWEENIDILNRIGFLYQSAHTDNNEGKNPEVHLNEIKELQESIRGKLEEYLLEIPKGH